MCILCKLFCPCGKKSCKKDGGKQQKQKKGEEKPFEKRKPHPAPADGSVEIYVGNLSYDMTEDQLRETFAAYGKVNSARLITNKFNGKSKGFGFVQMPDRAEADKAIAALNEKEIMGRQMKCNVAKNLI
ncbi:MAG: RNA-binding protein [bacterium]|nr:RNA-binding protein [Candidatus Colisoma equi]